jgi:hypothetical protein
LSSSSKQDDGDIIPSLFDISGMKSLDLLVAAQKIPHFPAQNPFPGTVDHFKLSNALEQTVIDETIQEYQCLIRPLADQKQFRTKAVPTDRLRTPPAPGEAAAKRGGENCSRESRDRRSFFPLTMSSA